MTTPTIPLRHGPIDLALLFLYLCRHCGNDERFTFHDAAGAPDIPAARSFAEEMRHRMGMAGEMWEKWLTVEQQYHVVRITSNADVPSDIGLRWYRRRRAEVIEARRKHGYLTDLPQDGSAATAT